MMRGGAVWRGNLIGVGVVVGVIGYVAVEAKLRALFGNS